MLTFIRRNWKMPIAYFLVKGTKAGIQSGIIRESILAAFDGGINVLNVTQCKQGQKITTKQGVLPKNFLNFHRFLSIISLWIVFEI